MPSSNNYELDELQLQLSNKLKIFDDSHKLLSKKTDFIFSSDVQYKNNIAIAGICYFNWGDSNYNIFLREYVVTEKYEPGYFAFREGPLVVELIKELITDQNIVPSLIIVDGHGIAHPRKFGVASYVGLATDFPTIGVAKETLVRYEGDLSTNRFATLPVKVDDEIVGYAVRTQENVNPVFVSPGHKISLKNSLEIVEKLSLLNSYRIIEPMRRVDMAVREYAKKLQLS